MAIRREVIRVPKGSVEKLCQALNVSRASVYAALKNNTNSETAQQIRRLALSTYGGLKATDIVW